jgi:hypothetical protein
LIIHSHPAESLEAHLRDYVAPAVDSFLFTRPTGLPLRRQDLSHAWKAACGDVGMEGLRPHYLRHHAATVIARNPNVTLRELMATICHSSRVAALRDQHATAERSREIADYLDGVISAAKPPNRPSASTAVPPGCGMGVAWVWHGTERLRTNCQQNHPLNMTNKKRRRAESNRRTGLCRPLPKPLGHAAAPVCGRAASLTAYLARPQLPPVR